MMSESPSCPRCGSNKVVPIAYGEPGEEMNEKAERGEIVLGGCLVSTDGTDDDFECRECGFRFFDLEALTAEEIPRCIDRMKQSIKSTRERIKKRKQRYEGTNVSGEEESIEGYELRLKRLREAQNKSAS